ncbi:hypothetical protein J2X47_001999 [Sphingomonas sp. BE270]|jgi:hypothetical protein|uniref:hypothetical protein n=1 Tax=Sphingomonas sp. BE270 TaxID=2817726 RepID=UPI00285688CD|nr:hypothetical protein [Sphingomonas sp. BE270]MDR7257819.1 hypothetical protein [Sphingomonas sp. BE270]
MTPGLAILAWLVASFPVGVAIGRVVAAADARHRDDRSHSGESEVDGGSQHHGSTQ